MRWVWLAIAALALVGCSAKAMQAGESPADARVEAALATARMLYQQQDYADARGALERAVQPDMLDTFSPTRRHEVIELYAEASWWGGDDAKAYWAWKIATDDPQASADDWQGRMMAAMAVRDNADAYAAFDHLRRTDPDEVRSLSPDLLGGIAAGFAVLPNAGDASLQLAQVLAPLERIDPSAELSPLWLRAAAVALAHGDKAAAAAFALRIDDPQVMVELRSDRRFDDLVAGDPATFDPRGLAERQLAQARSETTADPNLRAPRLALATALYNLGRFDEAVDALDAGLGNAPVDGEDPGLAASLAARKVTVLYEAGRADEALAIDTTICAVCQVFKFQEARLLLGVGRPEKVLPLLPPRDGAMYLGVEATAEFAAERACAEHQLGHDDAAAPDLDFLRTHLRYEPEAAIGALLCAGFDDEVARTLAAMLTDPDMRDPALGALQNYRADKLPPSVLSMRARMARIAARADIQAAVAKVGRVGGWDLPHYAIVG